MELGSLRRRKSEYLPDAGDEGKTVGSLAVETTPFTAASSGNGASGASSAKSSPKAASTSAVTILFRVLLLCLVLGIIGYVIGDIYTKPCTTYELPATTR